MDKSKYKGNTLQTLFLDAGLSEKETKIYEVLLEKGTVSAAEIIRISGLKKGITYNILYRLTKEELIIQFVRDGVYFFQPNDPVKLKEMILRKKTSLDDVSRRIDSYYPQLKSMYKLSVGKPTIRYFEGENGLKEIFDDIYGKKERENEVYGCVDLEKADEAFPSYITSRLIPKRIKNKVFAYSIIADSSQAKDVADRDKKQMRKTVFADKSKYPLPAEIDVYEDKIAMMSFSRGEFVGILIENKDLATSLKSIFKLVLKTV